MHTLNGGVAIATTWNEAFLMYCKEDMDGVDRVYDIIDRAAICQSSQCYLGTYICVSEKERARLLAWVGIVEG